MYTVERTMGFIQRYLWVRTYAVRAFRREICIIYYHIIQTHRKQYQKQKKKKELSQEKNGFYDKFILEIDIILSGRRFNQFTTMTYIYTTDVNASLIYRVE